MINLPDWLTGLLLNGVIGGVGSVLTFLPILLIFFTVMAILEDIGYMARAAFVMDRIMHLIGLHGKSFIPMFLGFGCNVPAVLGARIIETKKARMITLLLIPFVPCTAEAGGSYTSLCSHLRVLYRFCIMEHRSTEHRCARYRRNIYQ